MKQKFISFLPVTLSVHTTSALEVPFAPVISAGSWFSDKEYVYVVQRTALRPLDPLSWAAWVTTTKYHRLGSLNNRYLLFYTLEAGKSKNRIPAWSGF